MKRILILIAAPALLACAGRASAGQYEVHGCRTPAGAALPALGWLGSYGPGPWFLSDDTCARGGRLEAALMKVAGYEHPQGARSQWRFRAPEGTSIRRVRGDVAMRTGRERPYASPVAGGRADDGQGRFGIQSGELRGSLDAPAAPGNAFDTDVMSPTAAYTLLAACSGGGGACPEAAAGEPAVATVRVFRTQVTLEDLTPPALDSEPRGALTAPGVHRGVEGVSVAARDLGAGVRRLVAELDGRERATVLLDPNAGQCRELLPGPALDFLAPVPCAREVSGGVTLDTRALPEGEHVLRLWVEDAAGNRRLAAGPIAPFTVDNFPAPVAPVAPAPGPVGPRVSGTVLRGTVRLSFLAPLRRRSCARALGARACFRRVVRLVERRGAAVTQRYGRPVALRGRVLLADGSPVAGARVVLRGSRRGGAVASSRAGVRSDARGRFDVRLRRGPSERLRAEWLPAGALVPLRSRTLTRRVRAGLTVSARRAGRLTIVRGTLHGGRRPASGVPVLAEALTPRGPALLGRALVRRGERGLTLRVGLPEGRWRVRLRALTAPGWPFAEGRSRAIAVRGPAG